MFSVIHLKTAHEDPMTSSFGTVLKFKLHTTNKKRQHVVVGVPVFIGCFTWIQTGYDADLVHILVPCLFISFTHKAMIMAAMSHNAACETC